VPFLIALGLATAAVGLELTERFGAKNALRILAAGFSAIGVLASYAVTIKEQRRRRLRRSRSARTLESAR
jgi:hypothetical protein